MSVLHLMYRAERTPLKRYSVAVGCVLAASALTVPIEPLFDGRAPLFFFIIAVIAAAAYGGPVAGLTATALSFGIVTLFFRVQILLLSVRNSSLVIFGVLGIAISLILGRLQKANAEISRANQRLEEHRNALLRSNDELQRFAYALAHDLNAPLRGISALTDVLVQRNREKLDESSRECADMIVNRVQRLQAMIHDLLNYATAVEKPETRTVVDCNASVRRALQDLESAIQESNARITVDPLPRVRANEVHLVQVFANLLSNAIKYRPSIREPRIQVSVAEQVDSWIFCVADNGIGIDMKYAEEIFGMFRRLHGEGQYEGSGIGLALCRMVIQRHGGKIWVESEIGAGSKFFFTLPKDTGPRKITLPADGQTSRYIQPRP